MELGVALPRLDDIAADARVAEALGYDFASTGEHVFFHGPVGNGLIALAAAAGATERLRLMTGITLVPLYPPPLLAKQVATLDRVSNGRFELGVGVGGEFPREFEAIGVPVGERGKRTDEALELMQALWTGEKVDFEGAYTTVPDLRMAPRPKQRPHPPTWISGRSDAAMRRAAQFGDGWLPYMYTPEMLADSVATIARHGERFERTTPVQPGLFIFFAVHEDRDVALKMAADRLSIQYNQDFSQLVGKYALAGSPDDCVARLREYVDAGATRVLFASASDADYVEDNYRLLAETVVPVMRAG